MKMHNIYTSSCSAVFELINDCCYTAPEEYTVFLDGRQVAGTFRENVFSLFDLTPDTQYSVRTSLDDRPVTFRTGKESCCINVRDFGAVGDGINDDTRAIQMAVFTCPEGGRIRIPEGIYLVAPITLKSHTIIEIAEGAVLLGSTDEKEYVILPGEVNSSDGTKVECVSWEGCPVISHKSLLSAYYSEDIHIVGRGVIDGNAQNSTWWIDVKERAVARPKLLFTNRCRDIYIHGPHFQNSPSWHLHPYHSERIGIYDVSITAPKNSPNTDGCNPESCDTVEIIGARFSVGDDAIAIKSGKMYEGKISNIPASHHTIRNCLMEFAHGAVVFGSEMSGGIRDLSVSRCLFRDTDRGLRIKTRRGRGRDAVVDRVTFQNIRMEGVLTPFVMNMFYFCDPDGKSEYVQNKSALPVDERTPYLGRFCFKNMICTDCSVAAGFFYGLPEQPIEEIEISDVVFTFSDHAERGRPAMMLDVEECSRAGLYFHNVKNVKMHNVSISGVVGKKVTLKNVNAFIEDGHED